jgi:HrpA-like RNA helicase
MLVNKPETFYQFTHIVLDEIHERQTDNDLLSLVVKLCMEKYFYHGTKIIVMSATLQGELFSRYEYA